MPYASRQNVPNVVTYYEQVYRSNTNQAVLIDLMSKGTRISQKELHICYWQQTAFMFSFIHLVLKRTLVL